MRKKMLLVMGILSISMFSQSTATFAEETAAEATETQAPETAATETQAPETAAPETTAPETTAPETAAPETAAPETSAETSAPETQGSETQEIISTEAETKAETAETENAGKVNGPAQDATLTTVDKTAKTTANIVGFSVDPSQYPAADVNSNTNEIYRYLTTEMGLNHAGACGVLANIQLESDFSPLSLGDGGSSYGICQWHNERFNRLISYCNGIGSDYNTVSGQLAYLEYELASSYPSVLAYIKGVPDTAQGAYDAAYYWCVHFEVPNHTQERAAQRGNLAMNEYYGRTFLTAEAEQETEEAMEESASALKVVRTRIGLTDRVMAMRISSLAE